MSYRALIPVFERLCKRLLRHPNGCLEWRGSRSGNGYGVITIDYKSVGTHRAMWEEMFGPIPNGLQVLHTCDNIICCEPDHLFLGTPADNMADRDAKGRNARRETHGNAKLTCAGAAAIRIDTRVLRVIAAEYGVSMSTIHRAKTGECWSA